MNLIGSTIRASTLPIKASKKAFASTALISISAITVAVTNTVKPHPDPARLFLEDDLDLKIMNAMSHFFSLTEYNGS